MPLTRRPGRTRFRASLLLVSALVVAGGLDSRPALAQAIYGGILDSASVVPPTGSAATGATEITIDGDQLDVDISFSGLTGNSTGSHIHCCTGPTSNVGVAVLYPAFPAGVTSGNYVHTFDLASAATYLAAFITSHGGSVPVARAALLDGIRDGNAYTCVHSVNFAGGEIRTQLAFVSFADGFESADTSDWSVTVP